jgi:hypothetical protein
MLQNRKRLLGWLLAALMVAPFAVMPLHLADCSGQEGAGHHNCTDCPVCSFIFSSFTEPETVVAATIICYRNYKIFLHSCEPVIRVIRCFNLRAPPVFPT